MKFLILLLSIVCVSIAQGQIATISGQIENFKDDTIKLVLQLNNITRRSEIHAIPVNNGRFSDAMQLTKPTYFYLTDGSNYINGLIEPGDRVAILYDAANIKTSLKAKGNGSEKTDFVNSLLQLKLYRRLVEQVPVARTNKYPFDYLFNYCDSIGNTLFRKLDSIKPFMKTESYDLLRTDVKATVMGNRYRSVGLVYHESVDETLSKRKNELTKASEQYLKTVLDFDSTLFYSSGYVNEVYNVLFIDYEGLKFSKQIDTGLIKKYDYLNSRLPSTLGIPVITLFLDHDIDNLKLNTNIESIEKIIERTYHQKDSVYKTYVENRLKEATSFKKGMDAPDFIVENQRGEKVTLSSFKGKVIYLDFWYAACGPCHALFETLEPLKKDYSKGTDVVFLTVSIDRREVWEKALKKYSIDGYHVFTENREASHPIIKAYKVAGYPSTYLIDRNGKIFLTNPSKNPEELNKEIAEVLATPATNR